jgi:flagellin-like protein
MIDICNQDRGVSPVIAVILMVAITVILSAVIGTFVLDIGSSLSESPPRASFDVEVNDQYKYYANPTNPGYTTIQIVNLTMTGGEEISGENVQVMFEGERVFKGIPSDEGPTTFNYNNANSWDTPVPATYGLDTISAGTSIRLIAMAGPVYERIGGSWESGDLIWATNGPSNGGTDLLYDGNYYDGMKFDQGGTLRIVWESTQGNSQILYETAIPAA